MVLAVVRQWRREGRRPPRDVVLCFLADEEAGGKFGAHWMVDNHARPVRGRHRGDQRGRRLLVHRRRRAGLPDRDRPEGHPLAPAGRRGPRRATARWSTTTTPSRPWPRRWRAWAGTSGPLRMTPTVSALPRGDGATSSGSRSTCPTPSPRCPSSAPSPASSARPCATRPTRPCSRPATSTTSSRSRAEAFVDCRFLPGFEDELLAHDRRADRPGRAARDGHPRHRAARRPSTGRWSTRWSPPCRPRTRAPRAVPYCLSGGTDNKSFSLLGIRGFGFAPAAAAGRPRLLRHVPRRRRAGAAGLAAVRRPRARPVRSTAVADGGRAGRV